MTIKIVIEIFGDEKKTAPYIQKILAFYKTLDKKAYVNDIKMYINMREESMIPISKYEIDD